MALFYLTKIRFYDKIKYIIYTDDIGAYFNLQPRISAPWRRSRGDYLPNRKNDGKIRPQGLCFIRPLQLSS